MSIDSRWLVYRFLLEVWAGGRVEVIPQIVSREIAFWPAAHDQPRHGDQLLADWVLGLHRAVPDWELEVVETVISHSDGAVRWRGRGTHSGQPLATVQGEVPPSRRAFVIEGIAWFELNNGLIERLTLSEDTLGWFRQLGLIPGTLPREDASKEHLHGLAQRYFSQLMNQGQLEVIPELMHPEIRFHIPTLPQPIVGHEGMHRFVGNLRRAFPDLTFTPVRWTSQGDRVAARWTLGGTHRDEFLGHPATHNSIEDRGITVFGFDVDRIVTVHVNQNHYGLFKQLRARLQ